MGYYAQTLALEVNYITSYVVINHYYLFHIVTCHTHWNVASGHNNFTCVNYERDKLN